MNDGGIIVVEDTHTSYMNGYGPKKFTFMKYVRNLIDRINYRSSFIKNLSQDEKRIWSIEIIESMVAFKINRSASNEASTLIENGGIDYLANDFRYNDNKALSYITHLARKYRFLEKIPFARSIFEAIQNYLVNRKFKAKSYF